jgi:hypothetical protein
LEDKGIDIRIILKIYLREVICKVVGNVHMAQRPALVKRVADLTVL